MNDLKDRLKKARKDANKTQAQVAEAVGMKQPSYHQLESGKAIASTFLPLIADFLGVNPLWLQTGITQADENEETPSNDDFVLIPQYDASAACGNGHLNDYVTVKGGLAFRRDWIKSMGWQSSFLSVLYAVKDSMSPTINDGAIVLVNAIEKEPRSGSLYLISWYGEERIKRVFKDGNTVYRFSSDNQNKAQYPDERVDLSQTPDVFILGRVVWQAGTL